LLLLSSLFQHFDHFQRPFQRFSPPSPYHHCTIIIAITVITSIPLQGRSGFFSTLCTLFCLTPRPHPLPPPPAASSAGRCSAGGRTAPRPSPPDPPRTSASSAPPTPSARASLDGIPPCVRSGRGEDGSPALQPAAPLQPRGLPSRSPPESLRPDCGDLPRPEVPNQPFTPPGNQGCLPADFV